MKIKRLVSHANMLNLVLAAVLVVAGLRVVSPFFGGSVKSVLPAPKKAAAEKPAEAGKPAEVKSPFPGDYVVIAEQNLFHPERKIPVEKKEEAPLPKPEFVLYGTIMAGDASVAYMEDKKQPMSSPTRGKKQIPVRAGESLSGFTLKEIKADQVMMQRGEEKMVVLLNDAQNPKLRETAGLAAPAPGSPQQPGQPGARAGRQAQPGATPVPFGQPAAGSAPAPQAKQGGPFRPNRR